MTTQEELFERAGDRILADDEAVERGPIFHSTGLSVGGKFFGFVTRGDLVVKLPAERVAELVESGDGSPFDAGKGRPMREWVRLRPADEDACAAYLREARAFVGSPL